MFYVHVKRCQTDSNSTDRRTVCTTSAVCFAPAALHRPLQSKQNKTAESYVISFKFRSRTTCSPTARNCPPPPLHAAPLHEIVPFPHNFYCGQLLGNRALWRRFQHFFRTKDNNVDRSGCVRLLFFFRLNTRIEGSNPTRSMVICRVLFVLSCVGWGFEMDWSPVHEILTDN